MKIICILIVLSQFAFPAFENAFKFQYLGSSLPIDQDTVQFSQNKKSFSIIIPFGQTFLKLASLNFSHPFSFGNYELYMVTAGDKLYQENMLENKFEFSLNNDYNLALLMNTYLISIENYSTHYTLSTGLRLRYSNPDNLSYFIEYKNGFFITNSILSNDIPEIILISIFHENKRNRFTFSLVKDMLYPLDYQFYWKNTLHPNLGIKFGIINSSGEILGGFDFLFGKISPQIFILNHQNLGITYGFKIIF
ncbi:MAG: hypothetical protein H8E85_04040 [Candidatus Marinimicrobia bacterium]|nr:hypothetical protein [Candidatus Neomarinimicrobiota bacterium]